MRFEKDPLNISEKGEFGDKEKLFTFSRKEVTIGGLNAGYAELVINRKIGRAEIKEIWLEEEFRGKGYGKELYIQLGEELASEGITLFSDTTSHRSEAASGVWNALAREGKAKEIPGGYEFVSSGQQV